jgi:hypothetical protein
MRIKTNRFSGTWVPTKKRQPKESGLYIAQTDSGYMSTLTYSKKWNKWNAQDEHLPKYAMNVVAWMEMPPKYEG